MKNFYLVVLAVSFISHVHAMDDDREFRQATLTQIINTCFVDKNIDSLKTFHQKNQNFILSSAEKEVLDKHLESKVAEARNKTHGQIYNNECDFSMQDGYNEVKNINDLAESIKKQLKQLTDSDCSCD